VCSKENDVIAKVEKEAESSNEEDEKRSGVDTKAELIRLLRRLENSLTEQRHSEKVRTAWLLYRSTLDHFTLFIRSHHIVWSQQHFKMTIITAKENSQSV